MECKYPVKDGGDEYGEIMMLIKITIILITIILITIILITALMALN